jgi:DNA-binding winged helix-turn-helix (wHTH) protein
MSSQPTNSELRLLIVGDYLFEPRVGLLSGPSGAHHICSRLAALLSCLVEQAGEVVDRDYLVGELWKDEPHPYKSLTQCIGRLRHYFDDTARTAGYIETVPGRGYCLVAPVYGASRRREVVQAAIEPRREPMAGHHLARIVQQFRERKVCRAMLVYTIVIWLVFQVSEVVVPALNLPAWVNSLIVVLGILGFPIAATLSWIFDLTPTGLVRDRSAASPVPSSQPRNRKDLVFDSALISAAVLICGMLVMTCVSSSVPEVRNSQLKSAYGSAAVYTAQDNSPNLKAEARQGPGQMGGHVFGQQHATKTQLSPGPEQQLRRDLNW